MNIFPNCLHNFLPDTGICHWLAHPPDGGPAHNLPLTGICCLFAVRGGFENENQCATESIE